MPIDLVCLDADDTPWHNMRHFDAAEWAFFTMLEPFVACDIVHARDCRRSARAISRFTAVA
jgi:putative hydrolase of the HAD superfamily